MKSLSLDVVHGVRRAGPDNNYIIDFTRELEFESWAWAHSVILLQSRAK